MIVGYLVSLVYTPIMLKLLGQNEYGLYNLVSSVVAYLGVLNFGFGSAYIRYYTFYKKKEKSLELASLNGMFLIIFFTLGMIAIICGTMLALNTPKLFGENLSKLELYKAKVLMYILVINLGISFPNIIFNSYIIANEKFIFQKVLQLCKIITQPFFVIPILFLGYGSIGMAIITTVLNLIIEIVNLIYCYKKLKIKFNFSNFDFKLMKEIMIFSSYIFINLIVDQINWNVDKFLLGRFHGTVSVAIYGLSSQLKTYYMSISTNVSNVFIPRIHNQIAKSNNRSELTNIFTKIGRIQFMIISLISLLLFFFREAFYLFLGWE